jgi:hypothetical protein
VYKYIFYNLFVRRFIDERGALWAAFLFEARPRLITKHSFVLILEALEAPGAELLSPNELGGILILAGRHRSEFFERILKVSTTEALANFILGQVPWDVKYDTAPLDCTKYALGVARSQGGTWWVQARPRRWSKVSTEHAELILREYPGYAWAAYQNLLIEDALPAMVPHTFRRLYDMPEGMGELALRTDIFIDEYVSKQLDATGCDPEVADTLFEDHQHVSLDQQLSLDEFCEKLRAIARAQVATK